MADLAYSGTLKLRDPFFITSRLLAGVRISDAVVSLGYSVNPGDETRTRYAYFIDIDGDDEAEPVQFYAEDIQSGCQGGSIRKGFASLFSFLSAWVDALDYRDRIVNSDPEGCDMFPSELESWARANSDEFAALGMELEPEGYCDCNDGSCEACQHIIPIQED